MSSKTSSKNKKAPAAVTVEAKSSQQLTKEGKDTMNNSTNTKVVNFHGAELVTVMHNSEPHVAMKSVCDSIGIGWEPQRQRIMRHEVLKSCASMIQVQVFGDHQGRKLLFLPVNMLNGWLFGIDIKRCKEAIRPKLIAYQRECFKVLHDYWAKGEAVNPRLSNKADRTPLKNAVNMLIGKTTGMSYSDGYRLVHQRFGVTSVEDLEASKIPEAVEYIHGLILQGELLPKEDAAPAALESPITLNQISELPAGSRMIVTSNNGVTTMQSLGQCATVPLDQVMSIHRDFNYLQKLNMEMMERMQVLLGDKSPSILNKPLGA